MRTTLFVAWLSLVPARANADELVPSIVEFDLRAALAARSFRYTDTLASIYPSRGFAEPLPAVLPASPVLHLGVLVFPFAERRDALRHLGFDGTGDLGGFTTTRFEDARFEQTRASVAASFVGRFASGPVELLPKLGYALDAYQSSAAGATNETPPLPSVAYQSLTIGLRARTAFDGVRGEIHAESRFGLDAGGLEAADWFPGARFRGVALGALVGFDGRHWGTNPSWTLWAGVDVIQYGLDFNPVPADAPPERVVGGATDRTLTAFWGVRYVWPNANLPAENEDF